MKRVTVIAGAGFAIVSCVALVAAQAADKPTDQRAKPPDRWDRRVLDTFFPDARTALSGQRPQALGSNQSVVDSKKAGPASAGNATTAPVVFAWSQLISADTLQDEIKALQPQLSADVRTQSGFLGGSFKSSRRILSMLATMFAVIQEYDGDVRWKNQAPAARDVFAHAGFNCKAASEPVYREVKARADDLSALLRGESITGPENMDPTNHWDKVSGRPPLMSRMEVAQRDRIAPWTSTATNFKKNARALQHEAEIVAALSQVVSRDGFEYCDDATYQKYAQALRQAALDLSEAVKKNDYDSARTAADGIGKACTACHGDFRG